jgi:hypothetical protein
MIVAEAYGLASRTVLVEETAMAQQLTLPPQVRGEWIPMTSEEFDAWVPDGMQAEWVDGKGIIFEPIRVRHNLLGNWFMRLLATYLDVFDLGTLYSARFEMRVFGGASRRQSDLFVVLRGRRHLMHEYSFDGPADFVTEFVSKHNAEVDRVATFRAFAEAGVPGYQMIDPVLTVILSSTGVAIRAASTGCSPTSGAAITRSSSPVSGSTRSCSGRTRFRIISA